MNRGKNTESGLTAAALAKLIDVTLARVGSLAKEGVLIKQQNGRYAPDNIPRYIRWIRESALKKNNKTSQQIEVEKLRQLKRENDIAESLVAPVSQLSEALEKSGKIMIAILENLPLIMKRNWPEITGDQVTLVKKTIAQCRNEISGMEIKIEEEE